MSVGAGRACVCVCVSVCVCVGTSRYVGAASRGRLHARVCAGREGVGETGARLRARESERERTESERG